MSPDFSPYRDSIKKSGDNSDRKNDPSLQRSGRKNERSVTAAQRTQERMIRHCSASYA
ncbi:hypothetical protein ACTHPF_19640 [Paenibacillus sp. SAF-054]|uniref:hypothetical protein n=1 Tax=unclassified Paenibacillus TaxID=185978 RepID=UPI003F7FBC55